MIIRDIIPVKNIQNVIIYMPSSMKHSGIKIYKFYKKKTIHYIVAKRSRTLDHRIKRLWKVNLNQLNFGSSQSSNLYRKINEQICLKYQFCYLLKA